MLTKTKISAVPLSKWLMLMLYPNNQQINRNVQQGRKHSRPLCLCPDTGLSTYALKQLLDADAIVQTGAWGAFDWMVPFECIQYGKEESSRIFMSIALHGRRTLWKQCVPSALHQKYNPSFVTPKPMLLVQLLEQQTSLLGSNFWR